MIPANDTKSQTKSYFHLNISQIFFQKAAKTYGVPDAEVFQTPDLFEARNIPQVIGIRDTDFLISYK